jgi:DNA-binding CsgD family transcriptional regulator
VPIGTVDPDVAAALIGVIEAARGPAPELVAGWLADAGAGAHAESLRALLADQLLARGEPERARAVADEVLAAAASDEAARALAAATYRRSGAHVAGSLPAQPHGTAVSTAAEVDGSLARRAARRGRAAQGDTAAAARPGAEIDDILDAAGIELERGRHDLAAARLGHALAFGVSGRRRRDLASVLLIAAEGAGGGPVDLEAARAVVGRAERHRDGELLAAALGVLAAYGQGSEADAARTRVEALVPLPARIAGAAIGDGRAGAVARPASVRTRLSAAEYRVARCVSAGRTNRQAADELFLSRKTVDFHLQQIFRKLGINSRVELATMVSREAAFEEAL